jgi:sugar lactone lactonase YvrE
MMNTLPQIILLTVLTTPAAAVNGLQEPATDQSATTKNPQTSVVVGKLLPEEGNTDSTPSPLKSPFGIAFNPDGLMYIVELTGGRIHTLDSSGRFKTVAGQLDVKDYKGDGGPLSAARFNGMHNVAIGPSGLIYIADSWNHCIRCIDPKTNTISTIAGTGVAGFSGDGGPATQATFNFVMCITLNKAADTLHVADLKNLRIRAVSLKTGLVTTVAGNGKKGVPTDGAVAVESPLLDPRAVAADSKRNLYILERSGHALRVVRPDGTIRTVVGTGKAGRNDGPAQKARLKSPKHITVDGQDRIIIADESNALIRRYDPRSETVTTLLGGGIGAPPIKLKQPHGVCIHDNKLYVVDTGHDRILRIDSE